MTRLPSGSWAPIVVGFLLYAIFVVAAFFARAPALLSLGGLAMVFVASVGNYQRLSTIRIGPPARWALLAMVPPTLGLFLNPRSPLEQVLKYDLIFVVFLQIYSWRLSPLNRSPWRWALFGGCMALILVSIASGHSFDREGERRLSGVFQNPNNLALMGIALPFFLNQQDSRLRQLLVHAAAITTIALTGTLGAILGYAVGVAYRLRGMLTRRRATVAVVVLAAVVAAVVVDWNELARLRLFRQFAAIQGSVAAVQSDHVEYGAVVEAHGVGSTSALWRLTMWLSVARAYAHGDPWQWLLGRGLGASYELFGILPHNDFLRLLLETGVIGLVAFLGLCASAWRGMRAEDRWVIPMVLTFCLSENNLDNFMFMSLFMFFLASTQPAVRAAEPLVARGARAWRAAAATVSATARDARAPR